MSNRTEAATRKQRHGPPGGYSHCACSRLHPVSREESPCIPPPEESAPKELRLDATLTSYSTTCTVKIMEP
jgi:hypothetical protein